MYPGALTLLPTSCVALGKLLSPSGLLSSVSLVVAGIEMIYTKQVTLHLAPQTRAAMVVVSKKSYLFTYLKGRLPKKETERERSPIHSSLPKCQKSQSWARLSIWSLEPAGARNSIWSLMWVAEAQAPGPSPAALQGTLARN